MISPFVMDVLGESLALLEELFPVLSDPPATTQEAAVAVLCCRLRYAIASEQPEAEEDDYAPHDDAAFIDLWEPDPLDGWAPNDHDDPYGPW